MNRSGKMITIAALAMLLVASADAGVRAQADTKIQVRSSEQLLGVVTNENRTIFFAPTNESDLDVDKLRIWEKFSDNHPDIARAIAYHPQVLETDTFIERHPDLEKFFRNHPDIRDAMIKDPGNYEAIPPRPGE